MLAGPNGCGKSTISRWLYYMIDIATDFDSYLVKGYKTEINSLLQISLVLLGKCGDYIEGLTMV